MLNLYLGIMAWANSFLQGHGFTNITLFLTTATKKVGADKEIVILVATSGDTGKAALEGFKNVPGIKIVVFYPYQGVSKVQELQMSTTDGENTHVVAIKGNFDDCQTAVKRIFADEKMNKLLDENGYIFSSANSINWGRLLPQIVYYFWAYAKLIKAEALEFGKKVNFGAYWEFWEYLSWLVCL